jgi:hypothetical protein
LYDYSVPRFKIKRVLSASKRVGAGALALALLLFSLLAANSQFHSALHRSGDALPGTCLLCLFAHGHVSFAQPEPVLTTVVQPAFDFTRWAQSIAIEGPKYLASLSRAPPAAPLLCRS